MNFNKCEPILWTSKLLKALKIYISGKDISISDVSSQLGANCENLEDTIAFLVENENLEINLEYEIIHRSELSLDTPIRITRQGKTFYEYQQQELRRFIISQILLLIPIIVSLIPIIVSIVSAIVQ